jgi:Protein of unknown function (DUF1579)
MRNMLPDSIASQSDPKAQVARLAFLLGAWNAADTYEKSPFTPSGGSGIGIYKTVLGPGDFSVLTDYEYQGPRGGVSGHQVLAWDPQGGRYAGYGVTSSSPGVVVVSGDWESRDFVLVGNFEVGGKKVSFKEVFSDIQERSMTVRQYNSVEGGPVALYGTSKFTR